MNRPAVCATSIYSTFNLLDYTSSKVALNAVTVSFSKELEPFGIKVNAVEPGHVRTDLNGNSGVLTPEEGAVTAIKFALLDPDGNPLHITPTSPVPMTRTPRITTRLVGIWGAT